jgi:energy-coupling factor transporter transmembrane protein EcfT
MMPEWMKEVDAGPSPRGRIAGGKKSFIRKTLEGILTFFQESLASESLSLKNGLLQSLDTRFKLVSILSLEMAYRYIFLLTDLVKDIYLAKRARTIRPGSTREEQRWVGGRIGYILMRSMNTSEKVHMAMLSRGFDGEVKILQTFRAGRRDYVAGFFALSLSLLLVLISQNIIRI